jgi:hypothetical protein
MKVHKKYDQVPGSHCLHPGQIRNREALAPEPHLRWLPIEDAREERSARTAYDRLAYGKRLQHVRAIESAKQPETRIRRIERAVATLRDSEPARGRGGDAKTRGRVPPPGSSGRKRQER